MQAMAGLFPHIGIDRRTVLLGGAAGAIVLALPSRPMHAEENADWRAAVDRIIGDAEPADAKIAFETPEIAEDGATVPFTITVESPMSEADHVTDVHILATRNPWPEIATFSFTPLSGRATATSRMRLAETQDVIALAKTTTGETYLTKRLVKVTVGGCGG